MIKLLLIELFAVYFLTACGDYSTTVGTYEEFGLSKVVDLTVNYMTNPLNVDIVDSIPVFGWRMEDDTQGQVQSAYRIVVADSMENMGKGEYVWDTGRIEGDNSVAIVYEGEELLTGTKYYWNVYVWDKDDKVITADDNSSFETGISDSDWDGAKWIGIDGYDKIEKMIDYPSQYTIEYNVKYNGKDCDSGFIWGADEGRYGNYYQCEIDTCGDNVTVRIGELYNGEYIYKMESLFSEDKQAFNDNIHNVKIEVCNNDITVCIDNIEVVSGRLINRYTEGSIGLWTARGAYYAYYDNISISSPDGILICSENFNIDNGNDNIFAPYYIKNVDGWCEADSGYIMTTGWEEPAPMLRYEFGVDTSKTVASARIYASALGIYDIYINGTDICDEYMAPGQAVYTKEVYYNTYDVTEYINQNSDNNVVGVVIGHGRYDRGNESWGDKIAFIAKLVINYSDGTRNVYVTDDSWMTYDNGPIRNDDMYDGEYYDSNYELTGWSECGYDTSEWKRTEIFSEYDNLKKVPTTSESVKAVSEISPVSVSEIETGVYVYDFGQNFNGNCIIKLEDKYAERGDTIMIRYAEWINDDSLVNFDDVSGAIYTENLYTAKNTDYYVVSGKENEQYTPTFVYRGFRYVQIIGLAEPLPLENVSAYVISSNNFRTGSFTCSDDKINSLYNAIYWTQLSNYVDIPTDCPQRDERFGWTGDAQVFSRTAAYNASIYSFMDKYIDLLRISQAEDGIYPEIAPSADTGDAINGWSDAGVILVWEMYQQYGNKELIKENLDAMCKYVDYLVSTSDNYIRSNKGYGDHNAISGIDIDIIDTAQCAYVSLILAKMCAAVGKDDMADKYTEIYESFKSTWQNTYINEDGSIGEWQQSLYTIGLAFGLYPDGLAPKGAEYLDISVSASNYHLSTGYIATQFLLPVLCDYGYTETAYSVLMQDTYPSWNNMLSYGNTTITEGWNTIYDNDDGTYGINGSLNHMALGSVGQWFYEYMLGIRRDEDFPAFKHFYLKPVINKEIEYAQGSYKSMYGYIESGWKIEGDNVVYNFVIPPNTSATVSLGVSEYKNMELSAGTYEFTVPIY